MLHVEHWGFRGVGYICLCLPRLPGQPETTGRKRERLAIG